MNIRQILVIVALMLTPIAARAQKSSTGDLLIHGHLRVNANGGSVVGNAGDPATIRSPQLDVTAPRIDFDSSSSPFRLKQVRAKDGVKFRLNLTNATGKIRVETQSDSVTFDNVPRNGRRTLTLAGNVKGFYETGEARTDLNGGKATITYSAVAARDVHVELEGGAQGVRFKGSGSALAFSTNGALTEIDITAGRAVFDQKSGNTRFIGNARAVSNDGPGKFEVTSSEFALVLGANGGANAIDGLKTVGRTKIVVDLPPAPAGANAAAPSTARPTHLEIAADNALISLATATLTLSENVTGFYRVPQKGGAPVDYDFSGKRAVARIVADKDATEENPAGLNLDISGAPVSIEIPNFSLGD